ncbi:lipoprotein insertase outer membrane protein LolB [Massilia terrae]|uniref:Outer-membrane lipoprotein LolB n=1 Tax=Massilia terrae TaxID=1811224 RepID=A0ABT2CYL8_9BURK|nr:lipoprotein insertase outer membrane protein LolB [Massilia terrae]MCS0658656.1 lipoprotein insertase outer membrane protein LolB [Massilia terrae]
MQAKRLLAILAIAALLGGCATTSANLSQAPVAAYRDSIELSGRLFVSYQKDGQPQNLNGNFDWVQQPGRVEVSLSSQLGTTMARISVTPQQATLTQAGQQPVVAADIDTLTARTLGWTLPVSGLREWMQGYATDAGGKRFAASPANNTVTTKDGWRLRFVSWQDENAAHPVPKRIDAERSATPTSDELSIKIIIDQAA